jgi:hypothetical protein
MIIDGSVGQPDATVKINDSTRLKATLIKADQLITLSFHYPKDTSKKSYLLSAILIHMDLKAKVRIQRANGFHGKHFGKSLLENSELIQFRFLTNKGNSIMIRSFCEAWKRYRKEKNQP